MDGEAPQMGFAKIIWKALGLPAASCLLKGVQEAKGSMLCPEQPDPSMPDYLNPATL